MYVGKNSTQNKLSLVAHHEYKAMSVTMQANIEPITRGVHYCMDSSLGTRPENIKHFPRLFSLSFQVKIHEQWVDDNRIVWNAYWLYTFALCSGIVGSPSH